jgi:hypothetical protein
MSCPSRRLCAQPSVLQEARAELQRALDLPGTFPADRRAQDAARTLMLQHFK